MHPSNIHVLVACEQSQAVCSAFRRLGFAAYSCDILPTCGPCPEFHIRGDAFEVCRSYNWHCVIAHPPCTYLSRAGARYLFDSRKFGFDWSRFNKGLAASRFFRSFLDLPRVPYVAVENPYPEPLYNLPRNTCVINPYEFGDPYQKRTMLWLKGLPVLLPTDIVLNHPPWTDLHKSARVRSVTFPGIAAAMASQWGDFLVENL